MGGGEVIGSQCPSLASHGAYECSQPVYRGSEIGQKGGCPVTRLPRSHRGSEWVSGKGDHSMKRKPMTMRLRWSLLACMAAGMLGVRLHASAADEIKRLAELMEWKPGTI